MPPPTRPPRGRPAKARGTSRHALLFCLICLGYLGTLSYAEFGWVGDGQVMLDTAVSLREFGDLAVGYYEDPNQGFLPRKGSFGKYGIGFSVVQQIPMTLAGPVERACGGGCSNMLFALTNMSLTALTALIVALSLQAMGCSFRAGCLGAVGFAFGTPAWAYISSDFSEPLQALCLAAGFWLLVRSVRRSVPSRAGLVLAASSLGFAVMTKASLLALIPGFALYLWFSLGSDRAQRVRWFAWFGVPLALWGLVLAWLNSRRFGSMLEFGYGTETTQFTTPMAEGLYGLLLSPNKGLVFYAPLAVLVPAALWMTRSHRREVGFLLSNSALLVLITSKWWSWEGGGSWGPRLLLPIVPSLAICAAVLVDSIPWWPRSFLACVSAGAGINLLGVLLNFAVWGVVVGLDGKRVALDVTGRPEREYVERDGRKWFHAFVATNYVPGLSPILGHAWLLRLRYFDMPFSLDDLRDGSSTSPPRVSFPPVTIDFTRLGEGIMLSRLRSAHLWLWDTALSRPRERIFSDPVYGLSLQRLGDAATANEDLDRAEICYRRASALMPDHAGLVLKLSRLQSGRGRGSEAMGTLREYLARHSREQAPRLLLAQMYDGAGDRSGALREYRAYLDLRPPEKDRDAVERRIDQLSAGLP